MDKIINGCRDVAKIGCIGGGLGIGFVGGLILLEYIGGILCPPFAVLEAMILTGVHTATISGVAIVGSGAVAGVTKVHKELIK